MAVRKTGLKIIVAGLPRTGTMSLKNALEELGYGPCHHLLEPACQITRLRRSAAVLSVQAGKARQERLANLFDGYEVCLDVPGSACVDDLLEMYPDAQVILTTRKTPEVWLESHQAVLNPSASLLFRIVGFWVPGVYSCAMMVTNWRRVYQERFPGTMAPSAKMYEQHTEFVRALTPAANLLEFQVGAGWAPLCKFLGKPVPEVPFPRKNERAYLTNVNRLAYVSGTVSWIVLLSGLKYLPQAIKFILVHDFCITIITSQVLIFCSLIFTRNRFIRAVVLSVLGWLLYASSGTKIANFTENRITNAVLFSCLCIQFLRAVDVFLLSPQDHPPPDDAVEAFNMAWNMREIKTSQQVCNVPQRPATTRTPFLLRRIASFAVFYLLLEVVAMAPPPPSYDDPALQPMLEVVLTAVLGAAAFWSIIYMYLSLIYDGLSIAQVGMFLSEPSDWPPLFGPITEAWSLRRFWGVTWHQTLRKSFGAQAAQVLRFVPGPSHGIVHRYTRLAIIFALSGAMHLIADGIIGVPWLESGALPFFLLQAIGVVIEDAFQLVSKRVASSSSRRICGYIWVCCFLALTTGVWMDPTARYVRPEHDRMLPFKILAL